MAKATKKVVKKVINRKAKVERVELPSAQLVKTHFAAIGVVANMIKSQVLNKKAYHGGRETEIAVQGATGKLLNAGIVAKVMQEQGLDFTEAEARDGTIVRVYNSYLGEEFRFFLSRAGKYSGKFGVSGKARASMELAVNTDYDWVQQGSKNYYFSGNTSALLKFLGCN